jgi:hypothetical protein
MLRSFGMTLCVLCIYWAAGLLWQGVTLRPLDDAGTVIDPGRERPLIRLAGVGCLVGVGSLVWMLIRLGERGKGWWLDDAIAEMAQFSGVVGILLGILLALGVARSDQTVAMPYRRLLLLDPVIVVGSFWLCWRIRTRRGRIWKYASKPGNEGFDAS